MPTLFSRNSVETTDPSLDAMPCKDPLGNLLPEEGSKLPP